MSFAAFFYFSGIVISPLYLWWTSRPVSAARSAIKTLPMALFALAAWLAGAPVLLVLALALSALGDLALSRSGDRAFLGGLIGFALAHLCFILLFHTLGGLAWTSLTRAPVASVALVALALSSEIWLAPYTGKMRLPVRIYVTLITLMGLSAFALPAGFGIVALGAVLFVLSDALLSVRLFRLTDDSPAADHVARALWAFYVAGQALILAGVAGLP